jgi:hypothetical protein
VLFDFYTLSEYRGSGLFAKSLRQMFFDSASSDIRHIYLFVPENETTAGCGVETSGFTYEKSFFEKNRFGRISRWEGTTPVVAVSEKFFQQNEKPI